MPFVVDDVLYVLNRVDGYDDEYGSLWLYTVSRSGLRVGRIIPDRKSNSGESLADLPVLEEGAPATMLGVLHRIIEALAMAASQQASQDRPATSELIVFFLEAMARDQEITIDDRSGSVVRWSYPTNGSTATVSMSGNPPYRVSVAGTSGSFEGAAYPRTFPWGQISGVYLKGDSPHSPTVDILK